MPNDANRKRRERLRRIGIGAGVVVGVLVVGYLAAALVLQSVLDPAAISRWVEPRIEEALNRDVEIEGARVAIFPRLGLELEELRIDNLPTFDGPPLAEIGGLRLDVRILPLLRRQVEIGQVSVERPHLRLLTAEDGRTNFGDLVPTPEEEAGDGDEMPLDLEIRDVSLSDGRLEFRDEAEDRYVDLVGVEGGAGLTRAEDGGWRIESSLGARQVSLRLPALGEESFEGPQPGLRLNGLAHREFDWLEVGEGELRLGEAAVSFSGRADALKDSVRQLDLRLQSDSLPFERVVASLPDTLRQRLPGEAGGAFGLDLRITGPFGPEARPDVEGLVSLRDLSLREADGPILAEGFGGDVIVEPDTIRFSGLRGTVLDGSLNLDGDVSTDSAGSYSLRLRAEPRLDRWAQLAQLPEGSSAAGTVILDLSVTGRRGDRASLGMEGTARLDDLSLTHARLGVPFEIPSAEIELAGDRARWEAFPIRLGDDSLSIGGTIDHVLAFGEDAAGEAELPRLEATVRGGALNLSRIYPHPHPDSLTYGKLAFARMGDGRVEGRDVEEVSRERELSRPDPPPATGEIRLEFDSVDYDPYRLEDVTALLRFSPELIQIADASFDLHGGRAEAGLRVALGEDAAEPFGLDLSVQGMEAEEFFTASTPLGRLVSGTLSLDMEAAGALDSLFLPVSRSVQGAGHLTIQDGEIHENPVTRALAGLVSVPGLANPAFTEWSAPFQIEDAAIRFDDGVLSGAPGGVRFGGGIGFAGDLDLAAALELSAERLEDLPFDAGPAQDILDRLAGGGGPATLGIRIRGTTRNPSIEPDADLVGERFEEVVGEQLEERLQDRLEERREELEERGRGILRRFLPPEDSTPGPTAP